jgi:molybdate transport system substrate-binding protein
VSACVARKTEQPAEALRFARYLAASDRGLRAFAAQGYTPVEGDPWSEEPELTLYAGAMLKPAIERTITAFEAREGARVTRIYNGCGILVGQMGIKRPDAFFACDAEFLDTDLPKSKGKVKDLFGPPTTVSSNRLVILVHKGNPHDVRRLRDLAKPGLRVGVGHEKQCAMGVVTQKALRQDRTDAAVMRNVTVQSPTGDMLVNQMRTKSLDAAIVYISNAAGTGELFDAVEIDIPCAVVDQPYAVGKDTPHRQLAERLLAALRRAESRRLFEANGFTWKGPTR